MKVLKHGTKVKSVIGNTQGVITAVCIRVGAITYEMSYFSGDTHKYCWVCDFEIEPLKERTVGFGANRNEPTEETFLLELKTE